MMNKLGGFVNHIILQSIAAKGYDVTCLFPNHSGKTPTQAIRLLPRPADPEKTLSRRELLLCLGLAIPSNSLGADSTQNTTPPKTRFVATNREVLAFAKTAIGTTVGRGECWDLVQQALEYSGSVWRKPRQFGFPLKKSTPTLAGDIIQFQSARFEWTKGFHSGWKQLGYPDHSSIVYAVEGSRLQLAHQNVNGVRKVFLDSIDLNHKVSGSYTVFRPYKNKR